MVSAVGLAAIGIALTAFFGLGGVDIAKAQLSNVKSSLPKLGDSKQITSVGNREIRQSEPNQSPISIKTQAPPVSLPSGVKASQGKQKKPLTQTELDDIQRLNERRAKANKSKQPFKKTGEQIVQIKRQEAQIASKNKVFQNTNNFANPNFDLGLPNTATQADRRRVTQQRLQRNVQRQSNQVRKEVNAARVSNAQQFNSKVKEIQSRNLPRVAEQRLLSNLQRSFEL